jgi:hypothetical protein
VREMRFVNISGFWGQLVSSVNWLGVRNGGTWVTSKVSILAIIIGGILQLPRLLKWCRVCWSHFATALSRTDFLA